MSLLVILIASVLVVTPVLSEIVENDSDMSNGYLRQNEIGLNQTASTPRTATSEIQAPFATTLVNFGNGNNTTGISQFQLPNYNSTDPMVFTTTDLSTNIFSNQSQLSEFLTTTTPSMNPLYVTTTNQTGSTNPSSTLSSEVNSTNRFNNSDTSNQTQSGVVTTSGASTANPLSSTFSNALNTTNRFNNSETTSNSTQSQPGGVTTANPLSSTFSNAFNTTNRFNNSETTINSTQTQPGVVTTTGASTANPLSSTFSNALNTTGTTNVSNNGTSTSLISEPTYSSSTPLVVTVTQSSNVIGLTTTSSISESSPSMISTANINTGTSLVTEGLSTSSLLTSPSESELYQGFGNGSLPTNCSTSAGIETGIGQITASDWLPGFPPDEARMNGRSGWIGGFQVDHFLTVDLLQEFDVSGLRLQVHAQWPDRFTKLVKILYSVDYLHWTAYPPDSNNAILTGLSTSNPEATLVFNPPVKARYVVVNPVAWTGDQGPALRVGIFGCNAVATVPPTNNLPRKVVGDVQVNSVWDVGAPFLIDHMMRVWPGVNLTIKPGVEIYFTNREAGFLVEGSLLAEGTRQSPIIFQCTAILSYLTIGGFWKGLIFGPISRSSRLSYVHIKSAEIGAWATASTVTLSRVELRRCDQGIKLEGGIQIEPRFLESSLLVDNNVGVQIFNVTGSVEMYNVTLANHVRMAVTGYFEESRMLGPVAEGPTNFSMISCNIRKATYAVYLTGYRSMSIQVFETPVRDCNYGIYLDLSDSATRTSVSIERSAFVNNRVYGLYVDYKHFFRQYGEAGPWRFSTTSSLIRKFSTVVSNCVFEGGASGLSYYSPEVMARNSTSSFSVVSTRFSKTQTAALLRLYENSEFNIEGCDFRDNSNKALDISYKSMDVSGDIKNNNIIGNVYNESQNVPHPEGDLFPIITSSSADSTTLSLHGLISLAGSIDAQQHGKLKITANTIANNSFSHIISTQLAGVTIGFNLLDNPPAICELCMNSKWIRGGLVLNASHNWWGREDLLTASKRVSDFFSDLDLAATDVAPILKEARVAGASWDTVTRDINQGDSLEAGGIVRGNVTFTPKSDRPTLVSSSIYVPVGSVLELSTGTHLQFAANIGILVEGRLRVSGTDVKPIILEQQPSVNWKGLKLSHATEAILTNVVMSGGRGIQAVGSVPVLNSLKVQGSSESGLWIYVLQPTSISLTNSTFLNNSRNGVYFQIQGNGTTDVVVNITGCEMRENGASGLKMVADNIVTRMAISDVNIVDNSKDGVNLQLSDGEVSVLGSTFHTSKAGKSAERLRLAAIVYSGNCKHVYPKNIEIKNSSFYQGANAPLANFILFETKCSLNQSSFWRISNSTFRSIDTNPSNESLIVFRSLGNESIGQESNRQLNESNAQPTKTGQSLNDSRITLDIIITGSEFGSGRVGEAYTLEMNARHGENIQVTRNLFSQCPKALKIGGKSIPHNVTVTENDFTSNGPDYPIMFLFDNANASKSYSYLNFSYNVLSNNTGTAVVTSDGYNMTGLYNFWENPSAKYDLEVRATRVNATLNWWGTSDFGRILGRVLDGRTEFTRARAAIFPCLLSRNFTNISSSHPDVFQIIDGVIGGSIQGNVSLAPLPDNKSYEVQFPIRIPVGSSLTIQPGVTLLFHNRTGIYAEGELITLGQQDNWIQMRPLNSSTHWRGIIIGKQRPESMHVRLVGSQNESSGRVEALVNNVWNPVCGDDWNADNAEVVCKELGYLQGAKEFRLEQQPVSASISFSMSSARCSGLEFSLLDCLSKTGNDVICEPKMAVVVDCKRPPAGSRRKRQINNAISSKQPFVMRYSNIVGADIGLEVAIPGGVSLESVDVRNCREGGMLLNTIDPNSNGVSLRHCVVNGTTGGGGLSIKGSGPVSLESSNSTWNNGTGMVVVAIGGQRDDVLINGCHVKNNSIGGLSLETDSVAQIVQSIFKRNGFWGLRINASTIEMFKSLVEDHLNLGMEIGVTSGSANISNCAFVANGGNNVTVTTVERANGSQGLFTFRQSAILNSSINDAPNGSEMYQKFSLYLTVRVGGVGDSNSTAPAQFPISFIENNIIGAKRNGVAIRATGPTKLKIDVIGNEFKSVGGSAMRIETLKTAPDLHITGNNFTEVKDDTLVVDVRG